MATQSTNNQGLTAQQMGAAAQTNAERNVVQSAVNNPGTLQTSNFSTGQTNSNTGGILPTETKFQALTNPSTPFVAPTSNPNVLTSSDAKAYENGVKSNLTEAGSVLGVGDPSQQPSTSNKGININGVQLEDNPYNDIIVSMKNQMKLKEKELKDEQRTSDERAASSQQGQSLTQNAVNVKQGVAGTIMGEMATDQLNLEQARQRKDYADQKKKLLQSAWSEINRSAIGAAERKQKEIQALDEAQQVSEEDYAKKQKSLLELQKLDSQEGGAIYNMVQSGFEPDEDTLAVNDMMKGFNPGTSRTLFAAEQAIFDRAQAKEDRAAYKDSISIEKDLADLEDRPMERQGKLLDIQKKLRDSKNAVYDEMSKIFDVMKNVPEGMQVNIGDASYFGIDGGAIFEKDANSNGRLAFQDSSGNIQVQSIGNFGKPEDMETVYVNGMQILRNKKTQQLMPVNVGTNAQPGAQVWSEKYPDGTVNPYRAATDPVRGECGAFCNNLYSVGKVWGNTLSEKLKAAKQYEVPTDEVQVGDSIVQATNANWGHVAIVSQVFQGEDGKTMVQLTESNYVPPGGGKISNSRTMSIDDPRLKAVARIPLNPDRAPSSPADSLNSVGDRQSEAPEERNPYIVPGRAYAPSEQFKLDEKWQDVQSKAQDLLSGGSKDDIPLDIRSDAMNLARENGWNPTQAPAKKLTINELESINKSLPADKQLSYGATEKDAIASGATPGAVKVASAGIDAPSFDSFFQEAQDAAGMSMNPDSIRPIYEATVGAIPSYLDGAENLSYKFSGDKKGPAFIADIQQSLQNGDFLRAQDKLKKAALDTVDTVTAQQVRGREDAANAIKDIQQDLADYKAAGGDTGIFKGNQEKIAGKVGKVSDPERRKLATKIAGTLANYRRSISGAAFTESEGKVYESMFPSIMSGSEMNEANIQGLLELLANSNNTFYRQQLGNENFDAIFGK